MKYNETKNFEKHWRNIFKNQQSDFRESTLIKLIEKQLQPGSVLDAGCGSGYFSHQLLMAGYDVSAFDQSEEMIDMARNYFQKLNLDADCLKQESLQDLDPQEHGQFDNVICSDVLEHIEDDYEAYTHLVSVLKPGGTAVISVPALPSLYGPKDKKIGHYRRYSKSSFSKLLLSGHVQIEKMRYWNFTGVIPTYYAVKVFKRAIDESFRYDNRSWFKSTINSVLRNMLFVENLVQFPIGLTLIAVVKKESIDS